MPWWFYVLAVLWSVPIVAIVVALAWHLRDERREQRREATAEDRAEALIRRGEGTMVFGDGSIVLTDEYRDRTGKTFADLGQGSNPRARP